MSEHSFGDFLQRNSKLFTIMGVFGAIAVYFTQLGVESRWQRVGIVSSLTIFFFVTISIHNNIPDESSSKNPFDYILNQFRESWGFIVFYVAFWGVIASMTAIVLKFSNTLNFLLSFVFWLVGIGFVKWVLELGSSPEGTVNVLDDEFRELSRRMAFWGGLAILVGIGGLGRIWYLGAISFQELYFFKLPSPVSGIVVGISSGLVSGGALYLLIVASGSTIRYLYGKIPQEFKSDSENTTLEMPDELEDMKEDLENR